MVRSTTMLAAAGLSTVAILQTLPRGVDGHLYMMTPISRNYFYSKVFQNEDTFGDIEFCPHCLQARGSAIVQERAIEKTEATVLDQWGGGEWPGMTAYDNRLLAANGNFLEPDAIAVRHGVCGDPGQVEDENTNIYGRANSHYTIHGSYSEGQIIEIKVVVDTYHWPAQLVLNGRLRNSDTEQCMFPTIHLPARMTEQGHMEFFICDARDQSAGANGVVNQECFHNYPLSRASDDGGASPLDPAYPGRYYVDPPCREDETDQTMPANADPGQVVTMRYQLPQGLTCPRCILQMVHYTSHVCTYPGYREFTPSSWPSGCANNKEAWFDLGPELCQDGLYPEEFWNCADISIVASGVGT